MSSKSNTSSRPAVPSGVYLVGFILLILAGFTVLGRGSGLTILFTLGSILLSWIGLILTIVHMARGRRQIQTPAASSVKPDLPEIRRQPSAALRRSPAKEYQQLLARLSENIDCVSARQKAVEKLIDDSFGASLISSSRYKQVMQNAQDVLKKNYENASQAVALFGSSRPTQARLAILQNYVDDSDDVVANIDRVIDELLKLQQSSTIESGDALDSRLEELASTTVYYQKKEMH